MDLKNLLLVGFIAESNRIEGLTHEPAERELESAAHFLELDELVVGDLESLVWAFEPGARLREKVGQDVRVGKHVAPPGGARIRARLREILDDAVHDRQHPYLIHQRYEHLHPFMDGNGRSGRLLWAWQMRNHRYAPGLRLGFLHAFYYQTLEHWQGR